MTQEGTERGVDCAGVQRENQNRTGAIPEHISELFYLFVYPGL